MIQNRRELMGKRRKEDVVLVKTRTLIQSGVDCSCGKRATISWGGKGRWWQWLTPVCHVPFVGGPPCGMGSVVIRRVVDPGKPARAVVEDACQVRSP